MTKYILLFFLLSMNGVCFAEEITQYQVGVGTAFTLKNWSERPEQYSEKDLRPPPEKISFAVSKSREATSLALTTSISFLDSKSRFYYLSPILSYQFSLLQILGGLETTLKSFRDDSKYKDSSFNTNMVGAFIGAKFNLWKVDFHALFYLRKLGETDIAGNESIKTKMAHENDNVQKYGALWKSHKFAIEGELARFQYGETTIVSREFFYRIEKNTLYRASLGAGIFMGDLELWGRIHQFKNPDDDLAIYYQSPSFVPDYTLSQRSLFLELVWKI